MFTHKLLMDKCYQYKYHENTEKFTTLSTQRDFAKNNLFMKLNERLLKKNNYHHADMKYREI